MSWSYSFEKWYYQSLQSVSQFVQVFDASAATQWYAAQSNQLIQSSTSSNYIWNGIQASLLDIAGGYVATFSGTPQTAGQMWASAGFGTAAFVAGVVPTAALPFGGWVAGAKVGIAAEGAATALSQLNTFASVAPTLGMATSALSTGVPLTAQQVVSGVLNSVSNAVSWTAGKFPSEAILNAAVFDVATWANRLTLEMLDKSNSVVALMQQVADATEASLKSLGIQPPEVGGVLFDRCCEALCDVDELVGAYWDPANRSLVILGKPRSPGAGPVVGGIPAMDAEMMRAALRAAVAGQPLGVSIDPPSDLRHGGRQLEFLPEGTPLLVSYLGDTAGTLAGAIMFEADRVMKCLSLGRDNRTGGDFGSGVPGYCSTLDMQADGGGGSSWHRFWFVIDRVELLRDPVSGAIQVSEARIRVHSERTRGGGKSSADLDPVDEQFTDHLTRHYESYAREFPVFRRLQELAKLVAVARYLVTSKIPFDAGELLTRSAVAVATPDTTPSVTRSKVSATGHGTQTRSMSGGVDLNVDPVLVDDRTGRVSAMQQAAMSVPHDGVVKWTFQHGGSEWQAKALPLAHGLAMGARVAEDHRFVPGPSGQAGGLELERIYTANGSPGGDFGPGWALAVPWSLSVMRRGGKRVEVLSSEERAKASDAPAILVLREAKTGHCAVYRPTGADGGPSSDRTYARVLSQTPTPDGMTYTSDPRDTVRWRGGEFVAERRGVALSFTHDGLLSRLQRAGGDCVRWTREAGKLVKVEDASGRAYSVQWEGAKPGRIVSIQATDGRRLEYRYDAAGRLAASVRDRLVVETYHYDTAGRLVEIRNVAGVVQQAMAYTQGGEAVSGDLVETIHAMETKPIRRRIQRGRVVTIEDASGRQARFERGTNGQLARVTIPAEAGKELTLGYDPRGRLNQVEEPGGGRWRFVWGSADRCERVVAPDGRELTLQRDANGQVSELDGGVGQRWAFEYDERGRPVLVRGPNGEVRLQYRGKGTVPSRVQGGGVEQQDFGRVVMSRRRLEDGTWVESRLDRLRRELRIRGPWGTVTHSVDPADGSIRTRTTAGEIRVGPGTNDGEQVVTFH